MEEKKTWKISAFDLDLLGLGLGHGWPVALCFALGLCSSLTWFTRLGLRRSRFVWVLV